MWTSVGGVHVRGNEGIWICVCACGARIVNKLITAHHQFTLPFPARACACVVVEAIHLWNIRKDQVGAMTVFNEIVASPDADKERRAQAKCNIASILLQQGDAARCERMCREAIKEDPSDPHTHATLARALFKMGKAERAIEVARTAVAEGPNHFFALDTLAELLSKMDDLAGAISAYRECLKHIPPSTENIPTQGWEKRLKVCLSNALRKSGDIEGADAILRPYKIAHSIPLMARLELLLQGAVQTWMFVAKKSGTPCLKIPPQRKWEGPKIRVILFDGENFQRHSVRCKSQQVRVPLCV